MDKLTFIVHQAFRFQFDPVNWTERPRLVKVHGAQLNIRKSTSNGGNCHETRFANEAAFIQNATSESRPKRIICLHRFFRIDNSSGFQPTLMSLSVSSLKALHFPYQRTKRRMWRQEHNGRTYSLYADAS
jgi:hypothetical protein